MRLDNDGVQITDFDVRITNGGDTVNIMHPGMSMAVLNIATGKVTFNIFNSKINKIMKLKKLSKRVLNKMGRGGISVPTEDILELLMEMDSL